MEERPHPLPSYDCKGAGPGTAGTTLKVSLVPKEGKGKIHNMFKLTANLWGKDCSGWGGGGKAFIRYEGGHRLGKLM